jgi:hypothetical protein
MESENSVSTWTLPNNFSTDRNSTLLAGKPFNVPTSANGRTGRTRQRV